MSSITHHRIFPLEIFEHISRRFNGVIGAQVILLSASKFQFRFRRHPKDDKKIIINLFSKLLEAFQSIRKKYLYHEGKHNHIRIKIKETSDFYIISLSGSQYIPPGKIFKLMALVLWYYIRYKTGMKPNQSNYGRKLTLQWKDEESMIKRDINGSPRVLYLTHEEEPCHICGKLTKALNKWTYIIRRENIPINLETRVCERHLSKLI
jgi:hypothetical protein